MYNYLVEFVGTILLAYVVLATNNPLSIGLAYAFILLLTKDLTSGYMNPAIAIMMAATDKITVSELIPYCIVQVIGALAAYQIFITYKIGVTS